MKACFSMSKRLSKIIQPPELCKKLKIHANEKPKGFSDLNISSYYYENGLRKVVPYSFTFQTHCKGRWFGRRLIDVYQQEFRLYTLDEYKAKIKRGDLCVNGNVVPLDYILKNGDKLTSKIHRHETPVNMDPPIRIITNDENIVVVDKPSSIPVHPCGNYRLNSLLLILAKEYDLNNLYSCYRIDRLTSGLVIFAKNLETFKKIQDDILYKKADKEYLCLVEGIFPRAPITCSEPIKVFSYKIGISAVVKPSPPITCFDGDTIEKEDSYIGGKECTTVFERLAVIVSSTPIENANQPMCTKFISLVRAKPLTGRTHQIRVHAQYLGYPILNDPLYDTVLGWGRHKGRGADYEGRSIDDVIKSLVISSSVEPYEINDHLNESNTIITNGLENTTNKISYDNNNAIQNSKGDEDLLNLTTNLAVPDWFTPECQDCQKEIAIMQKQQQLKPPNGHNITVEGEKLNYNGGQLEFEYTKELPMYLHCYRYSGNGWTYKTALPTWAYIPELLPNDEPNKLIDTNSTKKISLLANSKVLTCNQLIDFDSDIYDQLVTHENAVNFDIDKDQVYLLEKPLSSHHSFIPINPEDCNPLLRHLLP